MELYNWSQTNIPNVFHFQGVSKKHYRNLFKQLACQNVSLNFDMCILTCMTNENNSLLASQLKKSNIKYINVYRKKKYNSWSNPDKITYIIDHLKTLQSDQICLILDGYDVAINNFDNIIYKFQQTNKRILFNATKNNYPDVQIDQYDGRDGLGDFRYFNAGCCIGYAGDLLKFYQNASDYSNIPNPLESEQLILRYAFAEVSSEHEHIDIDWQCNIFQTLGNTKIERIDNILKIV